MNLSLAEPEIWVSEVGFQSLKQSLTWNFFTCLINISFSIAEYDYQYLNTEFANK